MKVFRDFVQYSTEYWETRRAVPTASEFHRILTPGSTEPKFTCTAEDGETCGTRHTTRGAADKCAAGRVKKSGKAWDVGECPLELAAGVDGYIDQLVAEHIHFDPNFFTERRPQSRAVEEGVRREPESRDWLAVYLDADIEQVGFCLSDDGRFGCSPDGLVPAKKAMVELKNPDPATHVAYLRAGVLPAEYRMQCHGQLCVGQGEIERVYFVSYVPMYPKFVVIVEPDETTRKLAAALEEFWPRYVTARDQIAALC